MREAGRCVARRLRIEGRVQGVGFRGALHAEALRLGVGGWVRNRSDGCVEAFLCGEEARVNALIAWAHRGPDWARVNRVVCQEATIAATPAALEDCFPFRRKPSI